MSKKLAEIRLEVLYVWAAVIFGGLMLFLNPPFQVPDEAAHYYKSLSLAEGSLKCEQAVVAPANYISLPDDTKLTKMSGEDTKKISGTKLFLGLTQPASADMVLVTKSLCGAFPIGYVPQALGLKLGLMANAPPLVSFYLGRLLVFLLAVWATYWAVRVAPFGKIIFVIVGLLPMTIQQVASFSYDSLHLGLVALFIAWVLKLAHEETKLSSRQYWLLVALSLVALNVKPGYFFLSLLIFILPKAKFAGTRKYWQSTVGFVLASLVFFGVTRVAFNEPGAAAFPAGVDPQAQMWFVIEHPISFLLLVIGMLYDNIKDFYQMIVFRPGWLRSSLSAYFYLFTGIGAVLLLRSHEEKVPLTKQQRLVFLGVFLLQLVFVFFSLYAAWSEVGSEKISGVQGRYFLAILPLFIFSFYKSKFSFRSDWVRRHISLALMLFFLITFIFAFQAIIALYYKNPANYF